MIATHWATMVRPLQNHSPAGTVAGGGRRASREEANISQLISKSQRTQCNKQQAGQYLSWTLPVKLALTEHSSILGTAGNTAQ